MQEGIQRDDILSEDLNAWEIRTSNVARGPSSGHLRKMYLNLEPFEGERTVSKFHFSNSFATTYGRFEDT